MEIPISNGEKIYSLTRACEQALQDYEAKQKDVPLPPPHSTDQRKCVTYDVSSYSIRELKHLEERLLSELDQVRALLTGSESLPEPRTQIPEAESRKKGMKVEEKSRLATGLEELPEPMIDEILKIVKERNIHMVPVSDEIEMELDIDALDNETLWDLEKLLKDHQNQKMRREGKECEKTD